jgi:hypothetical protein
MSGRKFFFETVWAVDFETPCANFVYCLFLPMLPKKKVKREESAAAHWCFKVYSPCSIKLPLPVSTYPTSFRSSYLFRFKYMFVLV